MICLNKSAWVHLSCAWVLTSVNFQVVLGQGTHAFWGDLEPGRYAVGYENTIAIKQNEAYQFHDYQGGKPFFISFWYPGQKDTTIDYLKYEDYWKFDPNTVEKTILDSVFSQQSHSLQQYGICQNVNNWKTLPFGKRQKELYQLILNTPVKAQKQVLPAKGKFPCLIYHHGAGGTSDDNATLFEYLASKGWVVISSNFHWPLEGKGGSGNSYPNKAFNFDTDVLFVANWARELSFVNTDKMVYAGHSWGAQRSFFMNAHPQNPFHFNLIFDTTWENRSWASLRKRAPSVDSLLTTHLSQMKTPTVLITAPTKFMGPWPFYKVTLEQPAFEFFRQLSSTPITLVTAKSTLDHANFISQGTYRAQFNDQVKQKDGKSLQREFQLYLEVVKLSEAILASFLVYNDEDSWTDTFAPKFDFEKLTPR